mmetsp:Transcript_4277/g.9102  ORF Transcript_4277/g.9102 Transcript_4277/m.9102 type:complete len:88 (+) Transcript_4277:2504-2767(+)
MLSSGVPIGLPFLDPSPVLLPDEAGFASHAVDDAYKLMKDKCKRMTDKETGTLIARCSMTVAVLRSPRRGSATGGVYGPGVHKASSL